MIPPSGLETQVYPLRHRILYSCGLSALTEVQNSCFFTLIRHTNDVIANSPKNIIVNPHNTGYVSDSGPACAKMSIIDRLSLSLKFNMTEYCLPEALTGGTAGPNFDDGVYSGDGIGHIKLTWRPIFFSFREKLDAADDDTSTTVATILGLTADDTFEDVVPLTTNKLTTDGTSNLPQPTSDTGTNIVEVFGDYNMTTDTTMEDHPWDEDLFIDALRRFTNKGALKACVGSTRTVHLTTARPMKSYFINKFVPRSIRRVMPFTFMGIQINLPTSPDIGQDYHAKNITASKAHVGIKCICNYHEWHAEHFQNMTGVAPIPV